ncbi:MAG TPA: hypothetical protein VJ910_02125, partial [Desulfuromonadales bacterium]|nr:hypothetical protein [Desulfuromonadales bacterium]
RDELMTIPGTSTSLVVRKLLPRNGVVRKVGGPDYRYYVETDGDEKTLDGENMVTGASEQPWFDAGMWRLEIQPETGQKTDRFLVLLKPGKAATADLRRAQLLVTNSGDGLETPHTLVLFVADQQQAGIEYLANPGKRLHILTGLPPDRTFRVAHAGKSFEVTTSPEGILNFDLSVADPTMVRMQSL